jgi:arginine decarboxylase
MIAARNRGHVYVPRFVFFTSGVGWHGDRLISFELALRDAQISPYNLVPVSSIYPPGCRDVPIDIGVKALNPGQIVFCVMSRNDTREPGQLVSAAVGWALPEDEEQHGFLSECHFHGKPGDATGEYAKEQAVDMLQMSGSTVLASGSIAVQDYGQLAPSRLDTQWTTVVAAAVFIL